MTALAHMKWWGWGHEGTVFDHRGKPGLRPFILDRTGIDIDLPPTAPPAFDTLHVPEPALPAALRSALEAAVGAEHVRTGPLERVVHAYGKSLRDLIRVRSGDLGRLPDAVVHPADEEQTARVLDAALAADAVLIPFGGGSNISGSLEAPRGEKRPVLSLDTGRMNALLDVDGRSRLARVQAGIGGPELERALGARGWTMGHFPDSFRHSTLGGWIATRSSGMQSDSYGDMTTILKAVRVATPAGLLVTRPVPTSSTGPSLLGMVLGSEGRLGVITEAVVQIRPLPPVKKVLAYLFPDWNRGLAAMEAVAASEAQPLFTRLADAEETAFSFAASKGGPPPALKALHAYLKRVRGYRLDQLCLSFIGFEGSAGHVRRQRRLVERTVRAHGGVALGPKPGALYDQKKFDTPYIRDFLLDRGAYGDVSETSAPWSRLPGLYDAVTTAARKAFAELGVQGLCMCHLSHAEPSGACLYFTFAFRPAPARDPLAQYDTVKSALQQAFVDHGATLSHHHAVGLEHAPWLTDDISAPGVHLIRTLFTGTDPHRNLNPGKITG